ncbi:MAG: 4a-hydroxytetrahydrobiopterin dehydratase [Gammaproteobacteria bacterium]|nr:4a-hydroxytetrahydrobiopterin dehydratase [Gammaproteobacteria bacterium]
MQQPLAEQTLNSNADKSGMPAESDLAVLLKEMPGWHLRLVDGVLRLEKSYALEDFTAALAFTNRVGKLADEVDHHPAILTEYGKVTLSWWSHGLGGVHHNDLIMAARSDALL